LVERKTKETRIRVSLDVDGQGRSRIDTGIGFLDHMLSLFARHGLFDLDVQAKGDLEIDIHHTNEDVAICLGQAFGKALGDKKGIQRFGFYYVPMGEALVRVVLDISGRPSLFLKSLDNTDKKERYKLADAEHFLESFAQQCGINMNIAYLEGKHHHHILEALFKALGRALRQATQIDPREKGIPSTKGTL
jgi:imidazoleglycerol-phosphate dehydratase